MSGTLPPSYGLPQDPPAIIESVQRMEEGIHGASDAIRINEEIARQIGHVAVQGTSQGR